MYHCAWCCQGNEYPALAEVKEKHPELKDMTTNQYRKHYNSLNTEEQRAEAQRLRAKQVQAKDNIINRYYTEQKQAKKMLVKQNAVSKYTQGQCSFAHLCLTVFKVSC